MRIEVIHAGNFKLDGGAMFGVVPKSIWNNINPADELNMCNWAMRLLFIEDGNRRILIDTGIGDKQSEKFFGYYFLNGEHSMLKSLAEKGIAPEDITDVILTHLHFDHCGGALKWNNDRSKAVPTFPNATYWSHKDHWEHAVNPNPREKASFLKENILPIQESGQLKFVGDDGRISDNITTFLANGHTESMICPIIDTGKQKIAYMADLIPSAGHAKVNYVMSYDIRPLDTMKERAQFLDLAFNNNYTLFFEHDLLHECASLKQTERGIVIDEKFPLSAL